MKKIILILIACISFAFAQAQSVTLPPMGSNVTYQEVLTDYTLTNAVGRSFLWNAPQAWPCAQDFIIHLDSLSGNHTAVVVSLYGQKSSLKNDSTIIGSAVTWYGIAAGGSPDTTIIISNTSENRYRNYKSIIKGTGTGTTKIDTQALKLFYPD